MSNGLYQFNGVGDPTGGDTPVIADVKRYESDDTDPFAAFDVPKEEPQPVTEPKVSETHTEPMSEPEPIQMSEPTPEPEPEPEPEAMPKPEPIAVASSEPVKPVVETTPNNQPFEDATASEQKENCNDIFANIPGIEENNKSRKKRNHRGLWILLILLLLLLGAGGYYYYTKYYKPSHPAQTTDISDNNTQTSVVKEADTSAVRSDSDCAEISTTKGNGYKNLTNIFTFNTDLLEFTSSDHTANCEIILRNVHEYVTQFLNSRHYSNAMPYMENELSHYISTRLTELFDNNGYTVRRFFNTEDYLHQFFYNELKARKASRTRATIQSELMDHNLLDEMLRQVVESNDLSAADLGKASTTVKPKTPEAPKPAPVTANMETSSKEGFDVIAGFYTNRQSAIKMASRLKGLGCDAYIIDQNHLYYVSMGSAPTRTAAEALYKQVTSWYNGSVAIKQW